MESRGVISVFVVGTRAQLIKVAPVIVACEKRHQRVLLLLTGQHKETMQDLVAEFGITAPQEAAQRISERSTVLSLLAWLPRASFRLVRRIRSLKQQYGSVNVVVHGDTLSTVIGAFAARLGRAKVFHLESGLSSGRLFDPFPEELTRRIVFRLTDVALCPSRGAAEYMRSRYKCQVVDTLENTIVDAVMMATSSSRNPAETAGTVAYLVVSLHRFQNIFDSARLSFLVELIRSLAEKYLIHFVLHPATRKRLEAGGLLTRLTGIANINLSPRLGYREFLALASGAAGVLTDGGSNQEELAVLGVPTIVMRQYTERLDGLDQNAVMEGDLGGELLNYLLSGRHNALRRPSSVHSVLGPSKLVADVLESD